MVEIIGVFSFVLRLSKHEYHFFRSLLVGYMDRSRVTKRNNEESERSKQLFEQ
jgi:hypothetical protein